MEIVVHGTKDGRNTFTPKEISNMLDITHDNASETPIGQVAYSIRFVQNYLIYTKFKIVRDVLGEKRTGFLGISLYLTRNEKMPGNDTVSLLDRLMSEYCKQYIPKSDDNLEGIREKNWDFLNDALIDYKSNLKRISDEDIENLISGLKDDAFIYFNNSEDLQKYFDEPLQEVYSDYRQILFIDKKFENKAENPLNAIRHSQINLTGKIDLENPKYTLVFNPISNSGIKIDVKVNGRSQSNKSKIRKKDELQVTWSKPFYNPKPVKGYLTTLSNEDISVDDEAKKVYINDIKLIPEEKTITIIIKDPYGNNLKDADITYKSNYEFEKKVENKLIKFIGEDLDKTWTVTATTQNGNYKSTIKIDPHTLNNDVLVINLNKVPKIEDKKNNDTLYYNIDPGEHGSRLENSPAYTNLRNGIDINHTVYIKPNKGWEFKKFELDETRKNNGRAGTYIALYKKKKPKPWVYAVSIILPIFIIASVLVLWLVTDDTNKAQNLKSEIQEHVNSIELNLEKLKDFDLKWSNHSPQGSKGALDLFRSQSNKISDSTWKSVDDKIKDAIEKRNLINSLSIEELKSKEFSTEQKEFEEVIKRVDNTDRALLLDCIGKDSIAKMNLDEIAKSIQNTLGLQTKIIEDIPDSITGLDREDTAESTASNIDINEQANTDRRVAESHAVQNDNKSQNKVIIDKIKRGDISKLDLENLKKSVTDSNLKKSIELYLEFWGMVTNTNQDDYDKLLKKINDDVYLKDSELKIFLADLENQFEAYRSIPGRNLPSITINEIKKKMK